MRSNSVPSKTIPHRKPESAQIERILKTHYEAQSEVRRGVCLLNAGRFEEAASVFGRALELHPTDTSLAAYLASCLVETKKTDEATDVLASQLDSNETDVTARIRYAFALWKGDRRTEAIETLRQGIRLDHDSAELHFQLGTLLASMDFHDEAELRFVQALNLDPSHTEAMVSAALCCAVRGSPAESLPLLQRAQARCPFDARIGLLLTQAARAVQQQGLAVRLRAGMPEETEIDDPQGIEDLSHVIERDPEFVDALLSIPINETPRPVHLMLLHTLEKALARQPERAELHFHCGQVLERLGRHDAALAESERAVAMNPRFVRGLIELAKLYRTRNRREDAAKQLEQAVAFGAEYADVYCLLGHLYREQGEVGRAREAYRHALTINAKYEAAQEALAGLPVEAS